MGRVEQVARSPGEGGCKEDKRLIVDGRKSATSTQRVYERENIRRNVAQNKEEEEFQWKGLLRCDEEGGNGETSEGGERGQRSLLCRETNPSRVRNSFVRTEGIIYKIISDPLNY